MRSPMMGPSRRRRVDPATMASEKSIWDTYNNLSDVRDDESIKEWSDSLNFLLVFAAIFSAVLTALIVESMKLLQEDPQDAIRDAILHLSRQLANETIAPFEPEVFSVPQYALVVNSLLFSSLCCSLVAALAAVVALQWVNEYDSRINTIDSKERACIRHFRFLGMLKWKMGEIIAAVPLLLHASVFLFFTGIVEWMRNRHGLIFLICIGGISLAASVYLIPAILAAMFINSPFRSPMQRGIRYCLFSLAAVMAKSSNWIDKWVTPRINSQLWEKELGVEGASTVSKWTIRSLDLTIQPITRLKHIIEAGIDICDTSEDVVAVRGAIGLAVKLCLDKGTAGTLGEDEQAAIRTLVVTFLDERYQKHIVTTRRFAFNYYKEARKLMGSLRPNHATTESQIDAITAFIYSKVTLDEKAAAEGMIKAAKDLSKPTGSDPLGFAFRRYLIDGLEFYLEDRVLTHTENGAYQSVQQYLAELRETDPQNDNAFDTPPNEINALPPPLDINLHPPPSIDSALGTTEGNKQSDSAPIPSEARALSTPS